MQCIFLFKDAQGRLPTARELSRRGFVVSEAVLAREPGEGSGEEDAYAPQPRAQGLLLAAEQPAAYRNCGRGCGAQESGAEEAADRGAA